MSCGNVENPDAAEKEEVLMPRRRQIKRVDKSICQRCQVAKSLYIIRSLTLCKACFQSAVYNRFTKLLYPPLKIDSVSGSLNKRKGQIANNARPPRQRGDVLVALSSGAGSTAMLDLLLEREYIGKDDGAVADKTKGEKDPIWNKGWVVYVEFAGVLDGVLDRTEEVEQWVKEREGTLGWVALKAEDVFDPTLQRRLRKTITGNKEEMTKESVAAHRTLSVDLKDPDLPLFDRPSSSTSDSTPLGLLRSLLASLPAPSRPSLLSHILHCLLNLVAETLPVSHLLLGETSTRQAQRVIAGTALGRGWSLPLELAAAPATQSRRVGVTTETVTLRPMKDISVREAVVYCHIRGYSTFTRNERRWELAGPAGKRDARGKGGVASLEMLTEQFIASLSVTHPATVSTIIRTGDKLVFPGQGEDSPLCPVCQLPVDPSALEWKSRTALTSLPTKTQPSSSPKTESEQQHKDNLATLLCYACLTTFTPPTVVSRSQISPSDHAALPFWISERIATRKQNQSPSGREVMRDEIKEFLIDPEDGQ